MLLPSLIFGALNYLLYRSDKSSFSVDEGIVKSDILKWLYDAGWAKLGFRIND